MKFITFYFIHHKIERVGKMSWINFQLIKLPNFVKSILSTKMWTFFFSFSNSLSLIKCIYSISIDFLYFCLCFSAVQSLLKPNAYIVTQGPTEETVNDFWRMVWQENVSAIIMLTKTFDFTKVSEQHIWFSCVCNCTASWMELQLKGITIHEEEEEEKKKLSIVVHKIKTCEQFYLMLDALSPERNTDLEHDVLATNVYFSQSTVQFIQ